MIVNSSDFLNVLNKNSLHAVPCWFAFCLFHDIVNVKRGYLLKEIIVVYFKPLTCRLLAATSMSTGKLEWWAGGAASSYLWSRLFSNWFKFRHCVHCLSWMWLGVGRWWSGSLALVACHVSVSLPPKWQLWLHLSLSITSVWMWCEWIMGSIKVVWLLEKCFIPKHHLFMRLSSIKGDIWVTLVQVSVGRKKSPSRSMRWRVHGPSDRDKPGLHPKMDQSPLGVGMVWWRRWSGRHGRYMTFWLLAWV